MFTNNKTSYYGNDKVLIEAACLSTDTKPTTGIANGSACIEMDTGKIFMFNEEGSEWEELPDSSGSGGGGGGGYLGLHTATVNVTFDTSEIEGDVTAIQSAKVGLFADNEAMTFAYAEGSIPVTELGTTTQMLLPFSDGYITSFNFNDVFFLTDTTPVRIDGATVVSGMAEVYNGYIDITGDCSLNIKVGYQG